MDLQCARFLCPRPGCVVYYSSCYTTATALDSSGVTHVVPIYEDFGPSSRHLSYDAWP
jgi:hypothetical protein